MNQWLDDARQDLRFAARTFARRPGFTLIAAATLALGIGAATAVFSIVDAVLLRPLPYKDPARLVAIWDRLPRESRATVFGSYADFDQLQRKAQSFESVAAATWAAVASLVLTGRGPAQQVLAIPASASFFGMLGVRAAIGRTFTPQDEPRGCSVVLAHSFWSSKLGSDPNIVGQSLTLDQMPCTVLGVMAPQFSFYPQQASMWVLLGPDFQPPRDGIAVGIFAHLKPGVTMAQAQAEAVALHRALHQTDGQEPGLEPEVRSLQGEFTFLAGRTLRSTLLVVFAAVALVLLIACLNVANLLLGRLPERQRELALRAALGSGRGRLARQVLTEGLALSALGAVAGAGLAAAAVRYFRFVNPIELPVGADVRVNLPVLLFCGGVSLAAIAVFALLPSIRASRVSLSQGLKPFRRRPAKALIAVETALSFVLLIAAGLLMTSVLRMGSENLGFDPQGIVTSSTRLPASSYDALLERLESTPGVTAAALGSKFPPYVGGNQQIEIQGRTAPVGGFVHDVGADAVSPGYFELLRSPLLRGRAFDSRDRADSQPVAIVNQALAREYFANDDPIGTQIRVAGDKMPWLTVVGVAGNLKHTELMNEMTWAETPILYRPLAQEPRPLIQIAVRTAVDAATINREIQQQAASINPAMPAGSAEILTSELSKVLAYPRFRAAVLGAFALGALLLSAVGLYGVLSQLVALRTAEFGIRRAVGAQTFDLLWLVARQGGAPVILGLALGWIGALASARVLSGLLYGIRPADPKVGALVSIALLAVAAAAMALPARRAARVDPVAALREE